MISRPIVIPQEEVSVSFIRSHGPGGQNVNKVSTAVQLRFNVPASTALTEVEKSLLLVKEAARITNDGDLILTVSLHRSQSKNRKAAWLLLNQLISRAIETDPERRPTKRTGKSNLSRLSNKKRRSEVKQGRSRVDFEE